MKDWRECRLGEVVEIVKETYKPTGADNFNYIGLEHIEQETLRLNSIGHSTDITSNKFQFKNNDILFGKLRPYFRKVVKPNFSGICSTDIWVFRSKKGFTQDFLFYFLANWDFVDTASGGEGGTRMPRADWKFLSQSKWVLPPLPEQKAIASVLSSLDDKIDLLHRQNKTLETMAETLFRQWFVEPCKDGLPEGWEEGKLGDVVTICSGKGLKKEKFVENGKYPVMGANGLIGYTDNYLFDDRLLYTGRVGTLGNIFIVNNKKVWLSDNTLIIKPKIGFYYIYFFLKSAKLEELNVGSTQPLIRQSDINEIEVFFKSKKQTEEFNNELSPFFNKIYSNQTQIRTLEKFRDTLLPKLMSGEVRVEV